MPQPVHNQKASESLVEIVRAMNEILTGMRNLQRGRKIKEAEARLINDIRDCLERGADPAVLVPSEGYTPWSSSPMALATRLCRGDIIRMLHQYGAIPDEHCIGYVLSNVSGFPDGVRAETIQALLDCGANPDQFDKFPGYFKALPVLHIAVIQRLFKCMKVIIHAGAKGNHVIEKQYGNHVGSALDCIASTDIWRLFKNATLNSDGRFNIQYNKKKLLELLSSVDLLISAIDAESRKMFIANALLATAAGWLAPVADHLIKKHGANINGAGPGEDTLLCRALSSSIVQDNAIGSSFLKMILEYPEIDVNRPNPEGESPLKIAIDHKNCEAVKLLLHAGADIDAPIVIRNPDGSSNQVTLEDYCTDCVSDGEIKALLRSVLARRQIEAHAMANQKTNVITD